QRLFQLKFLLREQPFQLRDALCVERRRLAGPARRFGFDGVERALQGPAAELAEAGLADVQGGAALEQPRLAQYRLEDGLQPLLLLTRAVEFLDALFQSSRVTSAHEGVLREGRRSFPDPQERSAGVMLQASAATGVVDVSTTDGCNRATARKARAVGRRRRRFLPLTSGLAGVGGGRPIVRWAARTRACCRAQSRRNCSHSRRKAARALSGDGPRPVVRGSQATSMPCRAWTSKR